MSAETIKCIQMSHLEQELLEVVKKINHCNILINDVNIRDYKYKEMKKKEMLKLIAQKNILENKITEGMFLE